MSDTTDYLEELERQEQVLVFDAFDEDMAWRLGSALVEKARAEAAPVVIDIRTPDRTLFHAALPGASPDNDHWARRKSNVTLRLHKSSMRVGEGLRLRGRELGPDMGLDPLDFASHGGSFPIRLRGCGVVAAVTVSGLASREDHDMIIAALKSLLNV